MAAVLELRLYKYRTVSIFLFFDMYLLLGTSLLVTVVIYLYSRWKSALQYWADRGVPYEKPRPFLGSLTFLLQENMGTFFRKMYETFNTQKRTPYIGIWYFWKPVLLVNCPDIARNILVKDFKNFRNRHVNSSASDPVGGLNIFTVKDPLWTKIRHRLTPAFTAAKLRQLEPFIQQKTMDLLQRIDSEKDNRFSLRDTLADFTTDVIGTTAFGVASNATLTGEDPLRTITRYIMEFSIYRGIAMFSVFFWPDLVDIFRFTFFPKRATTYFKKIFKIIAAQREKDNTTNMDFMNAILQMKKEAALDGEEYSDDLLIAQSLVLLQGGFDTTAVTLTFVILELAFKPSVQDKLHAEVLEAKEKSGTEVLNSEILEGLTFLNCAMKETLRKYPPMPWLDRQAEHDYVIDENLTIKAGTPVAVNNIGMHYDPEYFPDPYKFDPERFLPENESNIRPYTYLPFGDGPRSCIGKRLGLLIIRIALSAVVLKYKLEPYADTKPPNETEIEKKGVFYMPGEKIYIKFVPRV